MGNFIALFHQEKSSAKAHKIFVKTYSENALAQTTCRYWFRRFKSNDFEFYDKGHSSEPKKIEDK